MVFNVTRDDIRVRMSATRQGYLPSGGAQGEAVAGYEQDGSDVGGHYVRETAFPRSRRPMWDAINEQYGPDYKR